MITARIQGMKSNGFSTNAVPVLPRFVRHSIDCAPMMDAEIEMPRYINTDESNKVMPIKVLLALIYLPEIVNTVKIEQGNILRIF